MAFDLEQEQTTEEIEAKNRRNLRKKFRQELRDNIGFRFTYYMPLVFSTIIATLGLMIDSAPVVIGAMLIAPLFWPILGVAYGVLTTREGILPRAILTLSASLVLVLFVSWAFAYFTPMTDITREIESRINPTFLDLLIALASSAIGILAIYWPQISESLAGVAISVALLPPLCTAGIGLALGSWVIFRGAGLLFITNMAAIVFIGLITLYLLGFRPDLKKEKKRLIFGIFLSTLFLVAIAVPLTVYFKESIVKTQRENAIRQVLEEQVLKISPKATLNELQIDFIKVDDKDEAEIEATVYLPEGIYLTIDKKNELTRALTDKVGTSVSLQLNVVNTLLLRREEDEQISNLRSEIESYLTEQLAEISSEIAVESMEIQIPDSETSEDQIVVTLLVRQTTKSSLSFDDKKTLEQKLSEHIGQSVSIQIDFIPVTRVEEQDAMTTLTNKVRNILLRELADISDTIVLDDLQITTADTSKSHALEIEVTIRIPSDLSFTYEQKELIRKRLGEELKQDVSLNIFTIDISQISKEAKSSEMFSDDAANPDLSGGSD